MDHHKKSTSAEKMKARCRSFLKKEIEEAKDNARLAYVLGARQKAGEELTEEEQDFIKDQDIDRRVLSKLESIFEKVGSNQDYKIGDGESFAIIRFFHLVRLTQQGLFHIISSSYPAIEPQAIIHLADKLVAGSMGGAMNISSSERFDARQTTRKIGFNLYKELDEPIAEAFKTTYKDIMEVANRLGGVQSYEQKKKGQSQYNHQFNVAQASATEVATTEIPPIWVVVPYSSMMNNSNALQGNLPSLPFPSSLFIHTPNTNHKNENDKRSKKNKNNKRSKNVEDDDLEQQVDPQKENVTNEIKSNDKQPVITTQDESEAVIDNNENKDNISEYKDNINEIKDTRSEDNDNGKEKEEEEEENDDDRFADAYSSDDDSELEDIQEEPLGSEKIDVAKENTLEEKKENTSKTDIDIENNTITATITPSAVEKNPTVPSQWQNFAASCHGDGDSNGSPLLPRSSSRSSPKFERK